METIKLNNGLTCPVIGIGTFMPIPADAQNSLREALKWVIASVTSFLSAALNRTIPSSLLHFSS